ncbi:MAG TPA: PP2C family serine/threonine-protein phosphatase, partial [Micromonosporaceae bacterium]
MTLTLRFAARSDRGLLREGNQDSVYAGPRLLAVADGMGGMAAGDVASNLAIAAMAPLDEDVPGDSLVDALRSAVELANQNLRDAVDANPALEGMGTTLTGMLFSGTKFGMVHVGDSRAYLLRDGEFVQVTKDDTYVQMLIDEGRITEEEASIHPQRSLLVRALQGSDVDPQYSVRPAVVGDRYLICSDGLSNPVSDDSIASTLRDYKDVDQCAERLVQLALRGGGPDNVTVIVLDVTDEDILEGRPYVGGAASRDRGLNGRVTESTPAARASALTTPRPPVEDDASSDDEDEPDPKRHPGRTALLLILVLAVLAGGGWYGWGYTQSRYYVGATSDGHIAVFQGVQGKIVGLKLNHEANRSNLTLDDLNADTQSKVKQGIPEQNKIDAEKTLNALSNPANGFLQKTCPAVINPSVAASPAPSVGPSVAPTPT